MKFITEIAKESNLWSAHKEINKNLLKKIALNILKRFKCFDCVQTFELSILLTDDKRMCELNSKFRNMQKATNVLSFPDIELNWQGLLEFKPDFDYMYLGDIAFGYQTIKNEANSQGKLFQHHFIHLFVHSILHLIGFDHENNKDASAMEKLEIEILHDFAISNVY
jgi:probable rRNA maturation factor